MNTPSRSLDSQIIHALKQNGRASIRDISAEIGAPRGAVSARLNHLIDSGHIRVFAAFDPGFAGQHVLVHSTVYITGPVTEVGRKIAELPATVFVSLVSGPAGVVFESRHSDLRCLERLLNKVRGFDGVLRIHTTTYIEVIEGFFVTNYREDVTVDNTDLELISALQTNGRMSYRELAERSGLAPSSARSRVARLIEANVISISAVESRADSHGSYTVGVGINTNGDGQELVELLKRTRQIDFSVRTYGRFNFIATVTDTSSCHSTRFSTPSGASTASPRSKPGHT